MRVRKNIKDVTVTMKVMEAILSFAIGFCLSFLSNSCYLHVFIGVNVYFVMGFRPFRPNYFTCTAHLYLYCTLLVPHTYASYIRH